MRSRNDAARPVRQRVPDGGATAPHRLATKLPLRAHTHRQRRERQAAAGLGRAKLASGGLDDHGVPAQKQQARVVMAAPVLAQTKALPGRRQGRRGVQLALLEANKDNDAAKANGSRNPNSSDLWTKQFHHNHRFTSSKPHTTFNYCLLQVRTYIPVESQTSL